MGRAERPEIIDAEFEVVRGPDAPPRERVLYFTLPNAAIFGACLLVAFAFLWLCLNAASDQANTACQTIEAARARGTALPQYDFCATRVARLSPGRSAP